MNDKDQLFQQLAAEEPPLEHEDTASSSTRPRPAVNMGGAWQQYLGGGMLLTALILTIAASLLFLQGNDDAEPTPNATDTNIVALQPTLDVTVAPTDSPTQAVQDIVFAPSNLLPTAAVDEAAVALLTPIPIDTSNGAIIARDNKPFTVLTGGVERGFSKHLIQTGDTLEDLIKLYDLTDYCTIVWSNERRKISPLKVGSEIIIPPVDGVFYKIRESMTLAELAQVTGVDVYTIIDSSYNPALEGATPENLLVEGMQIMVPGGNGGNCNVWSGKPTASGGGEGDSQAPSSYSLWGCTTPITTMGIPSLTPVSSPTFWQGFSSYHTGIDLSADTGTPVYASGSGTVIFSGWNNYGYGNVVVIAHGGTFTLYAHLSDYVTACGQSVSQGQTIGYIGSTGNSTGPHLHFEIWNSNGDPVNPCYSVSC